MLPDILGTTFPAISSTSNTSTLAMNAINPATLACTNGSFSALENAGTRTLRLVLYPKDGARRPIRIQVLVRMDASGSICIFARCRRRSLFMMRSLSWKNVVRALKLEKKIQLTLGASKIMDFTVASRITATVSVKPVCCRK